MNEGCTSLIVTGDAVEGPNDDYDWAILIKNSDTSAGSRETPVHVAAQVGVTIEYQNGVLDGDHDTFGPVTSYAYTGAYAPFGSYTGRTTTSDGNVGGTTIIDSSLWDSSGWTSYFILITGGPCNGEYRHISNWNNGTKTITVSTAFSAQITNGTTYEIIISLLPDTLTRVVFGQNERGLSVCHTQVTSGAAMVADGAAYAKSPNSLQLGGKELVTTMLAFYDDVDDIITDLADDDTILGQYNRRGAQCLSVIDNTGKGVAIEIAVTKFVYKVVTNSFFAHSNVCRMWDLNAQGAAASIRDYSDSGIRSQFIVTELARLRNANYGKLDYKDAMRYLAQYVNRKELGDQDFENNISGFWDICNDGTYASMVAVTGDTRYDGRLNSFYATYGNPPFIGCYNIHNAYAGDLPDNGAGAWTNPFDPTYDYFWEWVEDYLKPMVQTSGVYDPDDVVTIQDYSWTANVFSSQQWEFFLRTIEDRVADDGAHLAELLVELNAMIDSAQQTVTAAFHDEKDPISVTYKSNPDVKGGIHAYHMPYNTPIENLAVIPVVDGDTLSLDFDDPVDVDDATTCTLTVNVIGMDATVPAQQCSVSLNPAGGTYAAGTTVVLTPSCAGAAYEFKTWDKDQEGDDDPLSITIYDDMEIDAYFQYIVGSDIFSKGETYGIRVTATWPTGGNGLDGRSLVAAENPYRTPYFRHGIAFGDYPTLHLYSGSNLTIQHCIVDDDTAIWGPTWKPPPGAPAYIALGIGGTSNSIINCTLINCRRYGIGTTGATDFYIGYCTVDGAQYCISGSGGTNTTGVVEHNNVRGMSRNGVKMRGWYSVEVRGNFIDVTPDTASWSAGTKTGVALSDDYPNVTDCEIYNNVIFRREVGDPDYVYGYAALDHDLSQQGALYNTRNIFHDNLVINCTRGCIVSGNPAAYSDYPTNYDNEVYDNTGYNLDYNLWSNYGYYNDVRDNTNSP